MNPYPDFTIRSLTFFGETKQVFVKGSGPAVVVMHEVPGLHPKVADFGRRVVDAGFTVYMPSLFGTPGKPFGAAYSVRQLARACVSKEFAIWATGENSPLTEWLRALSKLAHSECGGPGVGAVGMCITGGFALAMMVDDFLVAPVLSQPSLPFAVLPSQRKDIGIDEATLKRVKERAAAGACVMGLRFTGDRLVPGERFQRLRDELADKFIAVEIDSSWGNRHRIQPFAHSVLTVDYVDRPGHPTYEADRKVLAFFKERLHVESNQA